jgi:hypothetical protein
LLHNPKKGHDIKKTAPDVGSIGVPDRWCKNAKTQNQMNFKCKLELLRSYGFKLRKPKASFCLTLTES